MANEPNIDVESSFKPFQALKNYDAKVLPNKPCLTDTGPCFSKDYQNVIFDTTRKLDLKNKKINKEDVISAAELHS